MKPPRSLADIRWPAQQQCGHTPHRADQQHRDRTTGVDRIGIGEAFLAVDHDAQPVAGIEVMGGIVSKQRRLRIGDRHRMQGHSEQQREPWSKLLQHDGGSAILSMQPASASATTRAGYETVTPRINENPVKVAVRLRAFMVNKK